MKKCHHMGSEEKNSGVLLAILGRGIQHPSPESTVWELTPDIELCDEKGAHLPFRAPENDDDPRSIIGGGQLNVLAGTILIDRLRPTLVVCAYGARSKYLNSIGAPSESEIMTSLLSNEVGKQKEIMPATDVFDEAAWHAEESGTNREIHNILTLANQRNIKNVALVTVAVHLPRTALMAKQHLEREPAFKNILLNCYASELVLLNDPEANAMYEARVRRIFASKSYVRNLERELRGMNDLLEGKYKSIASVVK